MALLQSSAARYQQYQDAHCQLVTGLVHALHGIPPGESGLRAAAEAAVQRAVFAPLGAALQEVAAAAAATGALSGVRPPQTLAAAAQQRAALVRLHVALRQLQALLNGMESYAWYEEGSSGSGVEESGSGSSSAGGGGAGGAYEVARGVTAAAVGVVLACWPELAEVCAWRCGGHALVPAGGASSAPAVQRELYAEVAHCLSSCISLDAEAFRQALPSFADTAATCFFLPGGLVQAGGVNTREAGCTHARLALDIISI